MATVAGKAIVPFSGEFSGLESQASAVATSIGDRISKGFTTGFGSLAKVAVAGLLATTLAVGGAALDMGAKYDSTLDQIAARMGETSQQAQAIGQAFLSTAGDTTFSAQQMAAAFEPVAGQLMQVNGGALNAAQSLTIMTAASALAEATGQDLGSTTASLASLMQGYGIQVSGAAAAGDVLWNTSNRLGISTDELVTGLDRLHGRLGIAAPSLQDTGGLMLELAGHGITGSRSLNLVATAMTALLDPAKAGKQALGDLGVNVYNANGSFVGMASVIGQLQPKLEKMTDQQRIQALTAIFGKGAAEVMNGVIGDGVGKFNDYANAVGASGSAQGAANTATSNLTGSFDKLKGRVVDLLISWGQQLTPIATGFMTWINTTAIPGFQTFSGWIEQHAVPAIQSLAQWIGQHVLPVLQDLGHFATATLIPAVTDLWSVFSAKVLPVLQDLAGFITDHVLPVLITLAQTVLPPLVAIIGGTIGGLVGALTGAYNASYTLVTWIGQHWPELIPVFVLVAAAITPIIVGFVTAGIQAGVAATTAAAAWTASRLEIMGGWLALGAYAIVQSVVTSGAWVAQAAVAAGAWLWSAGSKFFAIASGFAGAVADGSAALVASNWVRNAGIAAAAWAWSKLSAFGSIIASWGSAILDAGTYSGGVAKAWESAATGVSGAWATAMGGMGTSVRGFAAAAALALGPILATVGLIAAAVALHTNPVTPQGGGDTLNLPPGPLSDLYGQSHHQHGGTIQPGGFGIVGEAREEVAYGGSSGATFWPLARIIAAADSFRGATPGGGIGAPVFHQGDVHVHVYGEPDGTMINSIRGQVEAAQGAMFADFMRTWRAHR